MGNNCKNGCMEVQKSSEYFPPLSASGSFAFEALLPPKYSCWDFDSQGEHKHRPGDFELYL